MSSKYLACGFKEHVNGVCLFATTKQLECADCEKSTPKKKAAAQVADNEPPTEETDK
jgi:ribosomal protein S26